LACWRANFRSTWSRAKQIINALYPLVETELSGSVTAPSTSQSIARDLVVRAGALIETTAVDEIFVLPFNDAGGSTTFIDATSARHDFSCTNCPTANGGTVTFDGSDTLSRAHDDDFDLSVFSISAWIYPTARGGVIYNDLNDFKVEQLGDGTIQVTVEGNTVTSNLALSLNTANYLVVSYNAGTVKIYINSLESGTSSTMGAITASDNNVEIGSGFTGDFEQIALHASELTKDDILDVFNGLTFYATFDDGVKQGSNGYCGFGDSITQRKFDCDRKAQGNELLTDVYYITQIINGQPIQFPTIYRYPVVVTYGPRPDVFNGVVGQSVLLSRDSGVDSDLSTLSGFYKKPDNYLHFDHMAPLAGTSGLNDNAFSISMWLNPGKNRFWDYQQK
jgi:hypothetical protein